MHVTMSLLDAMAVQARCESLADLRNIDRFRQVKLARELEKPPPGAAALFEWNDALEYLAREPPQQTQEAARQRLISLLFHPQDVRTEDKNN